MSDPFISGEIIAHFKKLVELKMGSRKGLIRGMVLFSGVFFGLLALSAPPAYAEEAEDVKVIARKPDSTNPMYETVEVEGGLFFRAPKDMTFVKHYGVIEPISTEEYCLKKFEGVGQQIAALRKRIEALEGKAQSAPAPKDPGSL